MKDDHIIHITMPPTRYVFLKSKQKPGESLLEQRSAWLLRPQAPMACDEDLYRAVWANGQAIIQEIFMFKPVGDPVTLSPVEFCETWQGD